jgi:transketolase
VRAALLETLVELAAADERVLFLTGDLGWSVVEPFARRFPGRFLNVGVAEANGAGIAAGLGHLGFVPFLYSIATFSSMRCYEQVRNGAILHGLPVRIVGIGGGFAYGHAGPTHYALEDIGLMRAQPGMTVLVPADPEQTRTIVRATMDLPGPAYIRVGKGGNPEVPGLRGRFALERPEVVRPGGEILLLAAGPIVHEALVAADHLLRDGCSASVAVLAHLGFEAGPALVELLSSYPDVVTIEDGYAVGGLASLVAEAIAGHGLGCRLLTRAVRASMGGESGSEAFMRAAHGLDGAALARATLDWRAGRA